MILRCARCRRALKREPVIVEGKGYGAVCAAKVGDLLTQIARNPNIQRRRRRDDGRQPALFAEVAP